MEEDEVFSEPGVFIRFREETRPNPEGAPTVFAARRRSRVKTPPMRSFTQ